MNLAQMRIALDTGKISVSELTEFYLKRIKDINGELNCYITVCGESAGNDAAIAQKMIDGGKSMPLTGIPVSVKDNIATSGIKTTCASKMLENFVPFYDAHVIQGLKNEGAVLLGKTNMDEFAMGSASVSSYFGRVRNPYDTERIAGGSSGGAAAAVAAGLCAAALGSDTGGSVRQPAAFCGVTGLKPTYGAVSRYGLIAFASSFDQIGVIANSAHDAGYLLNSICGRDGKDPTSSVNAKGGYTLLIGTDISGIRIGIAKEFLDSAPDVSKYILSAVDYFKRCGAEIIECSLPSLDYAVSAYYLISSAEAASNLSRFDGIRFGHRSALGKNHSELISNSRAEGFGTEVKRRIMLGNYALSMGYYDDYYRKALMIRNRIKCEFNEIFEKCDLLLTPTAPTVAYVIGEENNDPVNMYMADVCTVPANIAGLPSINTVCGYNENGMPVGMSLTGRAFDEKTLITVCDRFEKDFKRKKNSYGI